MLKAAVEPSAADESTTAAVGAFADHAELASAADPAALLGVLQEADFSAFAPVRDLPPLRARLLELERTHGVTEAHRFATDRIRGLEDTRLQNPYGHITEIESSAVSPCGRCLATGSWTGDDYDRGGALQIWEIASGHCVNVLNQSPQVQLFRRAPQVELRGGCASSGGWWLEFGVPRAAKSRRLILFVFDRAGGLR